MKPIPSAILFVLPLLASCDKARKIADDASAAVRDKVATAVSDAGGSDKVDPELAKLVDRNDEGALFRKDLPFPTRIEVNAASTSQVNLRTFESSEIGRASATVNGVMSGSEKIERQGDHLRHTRGEFRLTDPTAEDAEGKPKMIPDNPLKSMFGAVPSRVFHRRDGKWRADEAGGFAAVAISRDLAPVFDVLLQEHGLAPRPQWFAKKRLKPGDEVVLTGATLPVLVGGDAKGTLRLKLESFGAVSGHPCGVFVVSGDYSRRQFPSFDGQFTDEDVTVQSGKVWLSLIHPLVLKWEADMIQSFKTGGKGGRVMQAQGTVKQKLVREWKEKP